MDGKTILGSFINLLHDKSVDTGNVIRLSIAEDEQYGEAISEVNFTDENGEKQTRVTGFKFNSSTGKWE